MKESPLGRLTGFTTAIPFSPNSFYAYSSSILTYPSFIVPEASLSLTLLNFLNSGNMLKFLEFFRLLLLHTTIVFLQGNILR